MTEDEISLRQYVDMRFESQEKAVQAALAAADRAVAKAEVAVDKRFESVNEFRQTLSDQTNTFLTMNEYRMAHRALTEKIDSMQKLIWMGLGIVLALQFAAWMWLRK